MAKFIYSFGIIIFGLSLGYMIQVLVRRDRVKLPIDIDALRIRLQRIALLFLNPVAVVGAIWVVSLKNATLVALPFVGLFALLAGGAIALGVARMFKLSFVQFLFHPPGGIKKTGHMRSGRNQGITEFEVIIVELDTHRR